MYARPALECFVSEFFQLGCLATVDALILETGLCRRSVERHLATLAREGRVEKLEDGEVVEFNARQRFFGDEFAFRLLDKALLDTPRRAA